MQNRRNVTRTRMKRNVRIVTDHHTPVICATVQDLTASGACLSVAATRGLPIIFGLSFDGCRTIRQCRTVWRSERQIGVAFIS